MRWSDLREKEKAPEVGWLLAYTRQKVMFQAYDSFSQVEAELLTKDFLELHLFDQKKEYRAVETRSKRFAGGIIETLADFPEQEDTVYSEEVLLEKGKGRMTILNHIRYDDEEPRIDADKRGTGMATVDNYRLRI